MKLNKPLEKMSEEPSDLTPILRKPMPRVEAGGLPTHLCCAWHTIAKNTLNPEGKLKDCYKCLGLKKVVMIIPLN